MAVNKELREDVNGLTTTSSRPPLPACLPTCLPNNARHHFCPASSSRSHGRPDDDIADCLYWSVDELVLRQRAREHTDADAGPGSLREAVGKANAVTVSTLEPDGGYVVLKPGTYTLSLPGAGEDGNLTGDLDITGKVNIVSDGTGDVFINAVRPKGWYKGYPSKPNEIDEVNFLTMPQDVCLYFIDFGDMSDRPRSNLVRIPKERLAEEMAHPTPGGKHFDPVRGGIID